MQDREKLDRQVRAGTRAVVVAQIASQLIAVAVLAVLYRNVERSAYGLLGMAFPLVMLPRMMATLGLSVTAIQRKSLSNAESSSLFWLNICLGLVAGGVTALLGIIFASLYGAAELKTLCWALRETVSTARRRARRV